jgi:hypothetical protein
MTIQFSRQGMAAHPARCLQARSSLVRSCPVELAGLRARHRHQIGKG